MSVPRVVVGDLNIFEDARDKLKEYLLKYFKLVFENYPAELTALSAGCIYSTLS